jgi:hypothetical protein
MSLTRAGFIQADDLHGHGDGWLGTLLASRRLPVLQVAEAGTG